MKSALLFSAVVAISCATALGGGMLDRPAYGQAIRSDALVDDYERNAFAADQRYKGKTFTVAGMVESLGNDDAAYLKLAVKSRAQQEVYWVRCTFANTAGLENLKAGAPVAVKGMIDGKRGNTIYLMNCVLMR